MKRNLKRIFSIFIISLLAVGLGKKNLVQAAEQGYEIYPVPHETNYKQGTIDLNSELNLVLESGLDQVTIDKVENVLRANNIEYVKSDSLSEDQLNIAIGVKDSEEAVDTYFSETVSYDSHFDEIDAHQIEIDENGIFVSGVDTDASFYGVVSLEHVLQQAEDLNVAQLSISDYSDTTIRGVIEGYYGIPWGNKNRADLIEFGGKFKANAFVFAPKDDPYHREKWRELYPADEIEEIRELAHLGNAEKNRYIWTIAPFKPDSDPITDENKEQGIADLINKFEQLYAADVRQFGVLGDDVGALPKETVVDVMNAVSEWAAEKGDIYDFVFVPEGYVLADWGFRPDELDAYDQGFPDDVQIMFTGQNVLSAVTQASINGFKTKQAAFGERRDPLFWLNWPVNDIDRTDFRRLFMGKGEMLESGVTNLVGVLTNPMEESQPSKNAIFAVADYSWNLRDFDADKSWDAGFKHFEPDAPIELQEISKHMASMNNGGIGGLEESVELNRLINDFKRNINSPDVALEDSKKVAKYFELIAGSIDSFESKSKQDNLVSEMTPYFNNLRDKSQAAATYLQALELAYTSGDKAEAEALLAEADQLKTQSTTYTVETKTAEFPAVELRAESGMLVINPFVDFIKQVATDQVADMKDVPTLQELKAMAEDLVANDEFTTEEAGRIVLTQLTALEHYESQNNDAKVTKHLTNFKNLLNHQLNQGLISEEGYDILYSATTSILDN